MQKILIPLFACLLCMATLLHAQVPETISALPSTVQGVKKLTPDLACTNFAGTFQLGQFIGQSNDHGLNTIYLCYGDSIFIDHNGDQVLTGDPVPGTPAGIGWAFYSCPPTIQGDDLATVITDCVEPGGANGIWVYTGAQYGDAWFFNSGQLQNQFNAGQPIQIYFAPITLDILDTSVQPSIQGFESSQVGFPPGPCVNVNTNVAFSVVYLNAITVSGVSSNFNNDCLGKFRVQGGFPQYDPTALYTVSITLQGNANVKALIHTASEQLFHNADVIFSAPQAGTYDVTIEDGKSCGYTFQITMGACNPSDNVVLAFPEITAPPGSQICVPLTVQNYESVSASFSVSWDPTVLQYTGFSNADTSINGFGPNNFNQQQTANGLLGVVVYDVDTIGQIITIANGGTLFEICFTVIGPLGDCSPLNITNTPTPISIEDENGIILAVTQDTGQVCSNFLPLSLTAGIDTLCFGFGTITACPVGGMPPYEITIMSVPAAGNPTYFANLANFGDCYTTPQLPNGDYKITLIDNNGTGDTIVQTLTINVASLGAALDLTKLPLCNGDKNGSVVATVFLGSTPVVNPGSNFTFTWNVPNAPNGPVVTGLGAGNIAVTITDNNTGCQAFASGTLGQPAPLSNQATTVVNATCTGVCDGTITYEAEGGTIPPGGYFYNWTYSPTGDPNLVFTDDSGQGNPIMLTNKCAGTYYVTITDTNGCTLVDSVEVGNIRQIDIMQTALDNVSCNGAANGQICVQIVETPASANPNYLFFWNPTGFPQSNTSGTTSCYVNLTPGTYDLLAIDALGCAATASYEITEPAPLDLTTASVQNPGCGVFQNNGKIVLTASGGTGGPGTYIYNWDDGTLGDTRQGLNAGTYCATVTDLNGCEDTICVILVLPPPPAITTIDSVSVKCGNDGCLTLITNPAGASYNWTLLDGTAIPNSNMPTVCGLNGGSYAVTVTDVTGCTVTDTLSLDTVAKLKLIDTTFIQPSCFGVADGSISTGMSGGTPPYTYMWTPTTPPQTGAILINVVSGFYIFKATDSQGCMFSTELQLLGPPQIKVNFPAAGISAASCFGVCDGSATPVVFYNTPPTQTSGNFNFAWENGSTDSIPLDLCPGYNTVIITDGNNCFIVDSVEIKSPPPVIASAITIDSVNCFGACDGSLTVAAGGGNGGPFSYLWSANAGGATTAVVTSLCSGTYVVTISDKNQCTGDTTIQLGEPAQIIVNEDLAATDDPNCFGSSDGSVAVTVTGGTTPYTYLWSDGGAFMGIDNPEDNLAAGNYAVTVTDANQCTSSFTVTLSDPPSVQGSYNPLEPLLCNGDETTLTVDTIFSGSGGPYKYSLDFGVTLDAGFPISIGGGEHYITYYDGNNCEFTDTIQVFEPAPIVVTFDPVTIEIELGDSIQLSPIVTGALVDSFLWSPAAGLTNPLVFEPTAYTFESETYTIVVFDANGCSGTGSILVNVDPNRNVFLPNIFKPGNSAGLNDHFAPWVGRGVEKVNFMRVYDRWGELMYDRNEFLPENQPADGWDGRYRGDWVMPGVYVYAVEVKFLDGRVLLYRGDVTVIR